MEFLSGMITGSIVSALAYFGYKFYCRTETKDNLIANDLGKQFEEKIRLTPKEK